MIKADWQPEIATHGNRRPVALWPAVPCGRRIFTHDPLQRAFEILVRAAKHEPETVRSAVRGAADIVSPRHV
jgi:hypothetical protein